MNESCSKLQFDTWFDAAVQASWDQKIYGDKRKIYQCWRCKAFHTSREKVNGDVPLLER